MSQSITKSFLTDFKDNNRKLLKLALVVFVLFQPVFILLGALPGYIVLTEQLASVSFVISLLSFCLLSISMSFVVRVIYPAAKLRWLLNVMGQRHFSRFIIAKHLAYQLPTLLLLMLGYLKVENELIYFENIFLLVLMVIAIIIRQIKTATTNSYNSLTHSHLYDYGELNFNKYIFIFVNASVFTTLISLITSVITAAVFFAVFYSIHFVLCKTVHQQHLLTFAKYAMFYCSITPKLASRVKKLLLFSYYIVLVVPILLFIFKLSMG